MKTLDHQKVIFWLDTQTQKEFTLSKLVPPHHQAEFLTIIEKRSDYTYNGVTVKKTAVKTRIEIVEDFFSTFNYPEVHSSSYGHFEKYRLKYFIENFIKCAKSKNQKIPQATKNDAIKTLMRLKAFLSAPMVS